MAAARLINHDYWENLKDLRSYQHPIESLWKVIPSRVQSLLANPAPIWCAANLIVGAISIPTTSLTSPWVVGSMAISLTGIVSGVLPSLTRSGFTRPSATSLVLNAATNASWGVTNLLMGSPRFGIALFLWATTSSILAAKQLKSTAHSNNLRNR